jgi:ferric-dicitrate binding protein FerR (iron transport regulator)
LLNFFKKNFIPDSIISLLKSIYIRKPIIKDYFLPGFTNTFSVATKETIETLYNRYLNNNISKEELEDFLQMLHTPEGDLTVSSLMDGTWREMFETPQPAAVPMYKRTWIRVAAAVIIFIVLSVGGYFIFNDPQPKQIAETEKEQPYNNKNDIAPGGNKAVLTLANGTQIVLDSVANGALTQQGNTKIIKLDNGQLAYNPLTHSSTSLHSSPSLRTDEVLYNTISTPKGGQYQIVLADGSKVWLNAASSLRFPASFSGKERRVELTGEGYFEVAKNANKPFRVSVKDMQVEVLGTHFNVNAYSDEGSIKTTLLEGSVKIKNEMPAKSGSSSILLARGEQADLTKDHNFKINFDANLEEVVAWKNGNFEFNDTPIADIMRQVSRWYDVQIDYRGPHPAHKLTGKISRNVNLSSLIDMLQYAGVNMKVENKKIIIWET